MLVVVVVVVVIVAKFVFFIDILGQSNLAYFKFNVAATPRQSPMQVLTSSTLLDFSDYMRTENWYFQVDKPLRPAPHD